MRGVTDQRVVLCLGVSAVGWHARVARLPIPADHAIFVLVHLARPGLYAGFTYAYATLWFTSSFSLATIGVACVHIFVGRGTRRTAVESPSAYPAPDRREDLFLLLGEQHQRTSRARAAHVAHDSATGGSRRRRQHPDRGGTSIGQCRPGRFEDRPQRRLPGIGAAVCRTLPAQALL